MNEIVTSTTPPTAPQWACRRARRGSGRLDGCVLFRVHVRSIARSACALLECWKLLNGQEGTGHPSNFRLRFLALALSHWLSPLRPLARASGGSPAGRGGGGRLDGRRRWRGHDRQERSSICEEIRWAPSGTHLFLGIAISWTMRMFTPSCCQGRFCSHCAHSHLTSLTLPPIFTLNLSFRSKPKVCTYFVLGPDPYASLAP